MRPGRNTLNRGPCLGAGMPRRHSNGRRQLGRLSLPALAITHKTDRFNRITDCP